MLLKGDLTKKDFLNRVKKNVKKLEEEKVLSIHQEENSSPSYELLHDPTPNHHWDKLAQGRRLVEMLYNGHGMKVLEMLNKWSVTSSLGSLVREARNVSMSST
ncbi:unnamed protein product [Microthlaspi erraticum]|uniref:Uncharacterized protein n=1 Tax=Microthlaspi erraticum TaxID=1685480 RepID=A0A6D2J8N5_9BRAS|nr:unnamed protein product [Microthlaspi erraticum]